MTKAACIPFLGLRNSRQWEIDRNKTCRKWRLKVIEKLNADPPDYIVMAVHRHALKDPKGRDVPEWKVPGLLRPAVRRTLRALPAKTDVLVLGHQPANAGGVINCLKERKWSMVKCTRPREPLSQRPRDLALSRGARDAGGEYGSLYDKICTYSLCPVVQGKTLMWRDVVHLNETFIRKLQPSFEELFNRKLGSGS